jgi:threonine dehydrogenase-like Zn-dependent dehydrogenase
MKAGVVESEGRIVVRDVPDLGLNGYSALVKIKACAICNGTDWKLLHGRLPGVSGYPFILGHESVGQVVEIGNAVERYKVGDMVLRPAAVYPDDEPDRVLSYWGGFAAYGLVFDVKAFERSHPGESPRGMAASQQVLPQGIEPGEATMYVTLKETYNWLRRLGVPSGSSVLILGSGPVGLCYALWAKHMGASTVIACGLRDERLDVFSSMGTDFVINTTREDLQQRVMEITGGHGVDRVVEAAGRTELIARGHPLLAAGGLLGVYGIREIGDRPSAGPSGEWGPKHFAPKEFEAHEAVIDAVAKGVIRPLDLVTHRLPLSDIDKGFALIAKKQALKVVIEMGA